MKALLKKTLGLSILFLAISCGKNDSNNSAPAPGQPPMPNNCLPNQTGTVPPGCPQPSTQNAQMVGDLVRASEYATVPLLKDLPGRLQRPYFSPYSASGSFRCQTSDSLFGATCLRECKNFRRDAQISVQILNGNGVVTVSAGPYNAPGICSNADNGSMYVMQIPVWIYNTNGNQGFTLRSAQAPVVNGGTVYTPPGTGAWNKPFSIEVASGSLTTDTVFDGRVYYGQNFLGTIKLYKRN